jgi:glycosyltransferase involved in cell wall biosynthesis
MIIDVLKKVDRYLRDFLFTVLHIYLKNILFKSRLSAAREKVSMKTAPGVNFAGYLGSQKGLGEAARSMIRILQETALPLAMNNIEHRWMKGTDHIYANLYGKANPYSINILHVNADAVPAAASYLGVGWFKGRYNIGYWVWELERFPEKWNTFFSYFDEIWTASNFCRDAISANSPVPVTVIPHSVEVVVGSQYDRRSFGIADKSFVFLSVFDIGSGYQRKNPLGAISAFRKAFKGHREEEVSLVLKFNGSAQTRREHGEILKASEGLPVIILDSLMTRDEVYGLMSLCDCYVSLHRSEGFGLTIAEAMYLGKPAIATGYSGNMEFMNGGNSLLVKYSMTTLERNFGPYKKGNLWAEPDTGHASQLMKQVFEDREWAWETGLAGSEYVKVHFSPKALRVRVEDRIKDIL